MPNHERGCIRKVPLNSIYVLNSIVHDKVEAFHICSNTITSAMTMMIPGKHSVTSLVQLSCNVIVPPTVLIQTMRDEHKRLGFPARKPLLYEDLLSSRAANESLAMPRSC
mmetsp:Transcript_23017/g.39556  ORF Transcript_23017/g.39556 Transcript_23017/m.39556 type:complete len:110 (-) Transcript_23017:568-897(-)